MLSGAMISMGRTLEKRGPALYSPECVEGEFSVTKGAKEQIFAWIDNPVDSVLRIYSTWAANIRCPLQCSL